MNPFASGIPAGRLFVSCLALACLTFVIRPSAASSDTSEHDLAPLRVAALDDLFVLRDYRPGKNSFVESPERHEGVWTGTGYRYTLLDLQGQGSLRHIWTTRGEGEPYFDWEFFVDGESAPSIRATDVELVSGAKDFPVPVAPANYLPIHNRAFNFYLPVPFDRSLRVDVVQRQPSFWLWFCQMDYRLNDASLAGARLFSQSARGGLAFSYVGLAHEQRTTAAPRMQTVTDFDPSVTIAPGQRAQILTASGPGIARECRMHWEGGDALRFLARYDDAQSFAIDSPLTRFFGPFEGVSYFRHSTNDASCYLPMPFRRRAEIWVENQGTAPVNVRGLLHVERVPAFASSWGYLHARHARTEQTDGHRLHQVLYVRGRGHWVGMTLFRTGHDHGGGDFAVIDGEGDEPAFLHGINGEDYFTFAWFGQGAHHPYAIAHSNDDGRYRHHFENLYPFRESIAIEWGAFAGLSPESVAVWYQTVPEDTTVTDGARANSVEWDVFGPVPIPHDAAGRGAVGQFSVLPSIEELDAGKEFECRLVKEHFTSGWMKEWSVGPMLNLTYLGRHGTKIDYEAELGGNGHAALARRFLESDRERMVRCLFAHDDPVEVQVNGRRVYEGGSRFNGFESTWIELPLKKGRNEIVVRVTNYYNRNFNWSGFLFRPE